MRALVWLTILMVTMALSVAIAPASSTPDDLYGEALEALEVEDYRLATIAITQALAQKGQEDVLSKARVLRLIAQYEIRTGRKESARDHLNAAVQTAGASYSEQHPEMVHLRKLLREIDAKPSSVAAAQSN